MAQEGGGASVRVGRFSFRIVARAAKPRKHSTAELIAHGIRKPGVYEGAVRAILSNEADSALARGLAVGKRVWDGSSEYWLFEQTGGKFRAVVPPRRVGTVVHHAVSSGMISRKSSPLAIERTLRPMVLNVVASDVAHYSSRIAPGLAGKEKGTEKPMHPAQKKYMTKAAEAARKAATKPGTKGLPPNLAKQYRLPRGWYSNRRYRRAMRLLLGGRGFNYEDYAGRKRKKKTEAEVRKAAEGDKGKEKGKEESKKEGDEVAFHEGGDSDSYDSEEDVDLTREPSPKPPKKAAPAGTQKDPVEVESDSAPGSSKRNPIKVSSDGETEPVSDKPAGEEGQEQKQTGDAEEKAEMKEEQKAHSERPRDDGLSENMEVIRRDENFKEMDAVDVPGDGNCLYHAVLVSARNHGEGALLSGVDHLALRRRVSEWIRVNGSAMVALPGSVAAGHPRAQYALKNIIEIPGSIRSDPGLKTDDARWEAYAAHTGEERVYGDEAALYALSAILNASIVVINSRRHSGGVSGEFAEIGMIKTVYLPPVPKEHVGAIVPPRRRIYLGARGDIKHFLGVRIGK